MAKLQSCGLKVLGDCVLNHRCASRQDACGAWNQFGGRLDWDARAIVRDDANFGGRGAPLPCSPDCLRMVPGLRQQKLSNSVPVSRRIHDL